MNNLMIYKLGGSFVIGPNLFELKTIDKSDLEKYKAQGWSETPNDAVIHAMAEKVIIKDSEDHRESLENQARELGIGFNARTTDETLEKRIDEALGAE